jgi:hypothetical protein
MADRERRQQRGLPRSSLRTQLNEAQADTLRALERFGWDLEFVRRPPFQDAIPVVVDGDRKALAVLRPDGSIEDNPDLRLRD